MSSTDKYHFLWDNKIILSIKMHILYEHNINVLH